MQELDELCPQGGKIMHLNRSRTSIGVVFGVMGFWVGIANGATIGLRLAEIQPGQGQVAIELFLELVAGDVVSGANTDFVCLSGDCGNLVIGNVRDGGIASWRASRLGGGSHIGSPEYVGLSVYAEFPLTDSLVGPSSGSGYTLATFDAGFEGPPDGTEAGFGVDYLNNPGGGVIDHHAQALNWDVRYHGSYSGYIAYGGFGYPGWGRVTMMGASVGQPNDNPLVISNAFPEPQSLVLTIVGVAGLWQRKRRS
ncbi:MAG: hypothetical protein H6817_07640 [Phycisphaerales bacterium]|nr:hypothetical protein [Phycisphaerales bacterium]